MSIKSARMQAEKLVERLVPNTLPIDPIKIATLLNLGVSEADLGKDVSGLLVTNADRAYVITNIKDGEKRKRFTIAHEIGHYYLRHQFEAGEHVHVDKGHYISRRDPRASEGTDLKEIEANQFAASLLMPSKLLREKILEIGSSRLLDHHVEHLAETFKVSDQAMTIRLTALGYF